MEDLFKVNLQREILREKSAEVLADFHRYLIAQNLEELDPNTTIGLLYKTVGDIYRNIFKERKYKGLYELAQANGKLDLAREILINNYLEV